MDKLGSYIADAILGIDTLWGGDVMCPSGTGRFIADSWFSDQPLPAAYTVASAARLRETGGVSGKEIDRKAVEEYLKEVDIPAAIAGVRQSAASQRGIGRPLAGRSRHLFRGDVGPGDGDPGQWRRRCPMSAACWLQPRVRRSRLLRRRSASA